MKKTYEEYEQQVNHPVDNAVIGSLTFAIQEIMGMMEIVGKPDKFPVAIKIEKPYDGLSLVAFTGTGPRRNVCRRLPPKFDGSAGRHLELTIEEADAG